MDLRGKKIFTGRMQLVDGWEVRPFAILSGEGFFSPHVSTRLHAAGSEERVYACDRPCRNKEEVFELALDQGRGLIRGR